MVVTLAGVCEWSASALGLLGAFLLATNSHVSRYGWPAFLVANVAMMIFALQVGAYGLLLQQLGLMGTNFFGLYRCGLWPAKGKKNE